MTPERWQLVKDLFDSAYELEAQERAAFLDRECAVSSPHLLLQSDGE